MNKEWSFDSEKHRFLYKNKEYPSVTTIIQDSQYAINCDFIEDWYRDRGIKIHRACNLFDNNTLDELSVDERIKGFLKGWQKFINDFNAKIVLNEETLFSTKLLTGGTLDRVIKYNRKNILVDIKTSATINKDFCGLQLAGYSLLLKEVKKKLKVGERWVVKISDDGKYKIEDLSDKKYIPMFRKILKK